MKIWVKHLPWNSMCSLTVSICCTRKPFAHEKSWEQKKYGMNIFWEYRLIISWRKLLVSLLYWITLFLYIQWWLRILATVFSKAYNDYNKLFLQSCTIKTSTKKNALFKPFMWNDYVKEFIVRLDAKRESKSSVNFSLPANASKRI